MVMAEMRREFQQHSCAKLLIAHEIPRHPDAAPRMANYFNSTKCYFIPDDDVEEEEELPLLFNNGVPRPITDELVMETFGLHLDPANPGAVLPDDPVGFVMPETRYLFGDTAAERRAARNDYDKDQRVITTSHEEYRGLSATGFAIMDAYSTKTGQLVYKDFLPSPLRPCGDVFGGITAIEVKIAGIPGAAGPAVYDQYMALKMTNDDTIATFRHKQSDLEDTLAALLQPINDVAKKANFENAVRAWERHPEKFYAGDFISSTKNRATFEETIAFAQDVESRMISQYGHPTGATRQSHSSPSPTALKPAAGAPQRRAFATSMEALAVGPGPSSSAQGSSFKCGGCKQLGHVIKDCPSFVWCGSCAWHHRKGERCDGGLAKTLWKSQTEANQRDRSRFGTPFAGAGGGVDRRPAAGGGRR